MRVIQNSEAGSFEATLYPSIDLWCIRMDLEDGSRVTLNQSLIEWGRKKKAVAGTDPLRATALDRLCKGVLLYGFTNTKEEGIIYD